MPMSMEEYKLTYVINLNNFPLQNMVQSTYKFLFPKENCAIEDPESSYLIICFPRKMQIIVGIHTPNHKIA